MTDGSGREVESMDGRDFRLDDDNAEPRGYLSVYQGRNGLIHLISSRQHYVFNLKWIDSSYNPPAACVGDLDNDRDVDFADMQKLMDHWLWSSEQLGGGYIADIDEDGDVDFDDFAAAGSRWQGSCQ
jgi:hypothetical protein